MTRPVSTAIGGACEFDCEGCGIHVIAPALDRPPAHGFCLVCTWLSEYVSDPIEMMTLRDRLFPENKMLERPARGHRRPAQ